MCIRDRFKKLQEARPNAPLMCSEFWSGWFDHWGRKHETRDAETMVSGIKDMLDRHISFSLRMEELLLDIGEEQIVLLILPCAVLMIMMLPSVKRVGRLLNIISCGR